MGPKQENPEKKHLALPQTELGFSHMCHIHVYGTSPQPKQQLDDRMIKHGNGTYNKMTLHKCIIPQQTHTNIKVNMVTNKHADKVVDEIHVL